MKLSIFGKAILLVDFRLKCQGNLARELVGKFVKSQSNDSQCTMIIMIS